MFTTQPKNIKGPSLEVCGSLRSRNLTWRTSEYIIEAVAARLFALILSLRYVARIQTSLNSCDRSQRQNSFAATKIFTRRFVAATCRGDVSQRFVT